MILVSLLALILNLNPSFHVEISNVKSGLCYQNFKTQTIDLPKGLNQEIEALKIYDHSRFANGSILIRDSLLSPTESIIPIGLFDGCCESYEPAEDLRKIREESKQETKYYLAGKVPYSPNFTSVLILAERHWTSNCENEKEVLLLNTKDGKMLSLVRIGVVDFGRTIAGMTRLKKNRIFYYEDTPFLSDIDVSVEALKAAKANKELLEFTINYATFRINNSGYIEVISKGKV